MFWHSLDKRQEIAIQFYACTGLTKVPIDGQPKSIVKDLEEMARTYIKVHCPGILACSCLNVVHLT